MMVVDEVITHPVRGILSYPQAGDPCAGVLLCGPNPFLGGGQDNPVLQAMATGLVDAGALVLTLEYPAWHPAITDHRFHQLRDQFWANEFLPQQMPQDIDVGRRALEYLASLLGARPPMAAAGYSYGGALALELAQRNSLPTFSISPPLRTLPLTTKLASGEAVLLRAQEDLALTQEEVAAFASRGVHRFAEEILLSSEDHFFLKELPRIAAASARWITGLCVR